MKFTTHENVLLQRLIANQISKIESTAKSLKYPHDIRFVRNEIPTYEHILDKLKDEI